MNANSFWGDKVIKGVKYYQENGLFRFVLKLLKVLLQISKYYCRRMFCIINMKLNKFGRFSQMKPYPDMPEIILSLTSFPARINTTHKAIESLMVQTYQADRIILWLANEEFPNGEKDLPTALRRLKTRGLDIRWCENIRSYKKLIPTLIQYPESIIITVDDDTLCDKHMVERLIAGYRERPDCIQCHWPTVMIYHPEDGIKINTEDMQEYPIPSYLHLLKGCAGCLYPPHCLYEDILNTDLIMELAPTNDDIWFWAMGILNGYKINVVKDNITEMIYIPGTQLHSLCLINDGNEQLFSKQLKKVVQYYPDLQQRLENEQKAIKKV